MNTIKLLFVSTTFIFFTCLTSFAQINQIPEEIEFAGMKLHITEGAQKLILADINSITKNKKFFSQKIDRANLYFPIIEKVFTEENFPSDFKYLALQESSLVSDVVSTSNAVGYWQFKKESAVEVGLRVDKEVDERMNIVASTRGAAKYLKKNNYFLNNWIYTLLAFNLGRGGVASSVKEKYKGSTEMEIDKNMHWYVIRFLAHKLAYENLVGKYPHPELLLKLYPSKPNITLTQIAEETKINLEELQYFNKWILKSKVPEDKIYKIILPIKINQSEQYIAGLEDAESATIKYETPESEVKIKKSNGETKVKIINKGGKNKVALPAGFDEKNLPKVISYNKLRAIQAREGDNYSMLAYTAGLNLNDFLKRNEMQKGDQIEVGQYYYIEAKRGHGLINFHIAKPGENLWQISQNYGMRINSLRKKNRMKSQEVLLPGRVLWLRKKRPRKMEVEYKYVKSKSNVDATSLEPIIEAVVIKEKKVVLADTIVDIVPDMPSDISEPPILNENSDELEIFQDNKDSNFKYHVVEKRQTLYAISRLYNTKVDSLTKWNPITNDLKIGASIIVGRNYAQKMQNDIKTSLHYIVKSGDTIYKISRLYGVSIAQIKLWNNKVDNNVSVGEQIVIVK